MRFLIPLALAVLGAGCEPSGEAAAPAVAGESPIVEVESAEALVQDLDALDAEAVVLNFWATWCGPCKAEFPEFVRFDREMDGEPVEVRFVSVDTPGDLPAVRAFLDEHGVAEPSYLYTGPGDVTAQLNPFVGGAVPITMVLDGEGIVQYTHVGMLAYDSLSEAVAAVREGRNPEEATQG